MDRIAKAGFVDLWRRANRDGREFTWFSNKGNGFRLDHAFASRAVADRVKEVRYSHAEREVKGLSDHSALIVELDDVASGSTSGEGDLQ